MAKVKVSEISQELGISNKEVIEKAHAIGIVAKAASSSVDEQEAVMLIRFVLTGKLPDSDNKPKKSPKAKETKETKKVSSKVKVTAKSTKSTKEEVKPKKTNKDNSVEKTITKESSVPVKIKIEEKVETKKVESLATNSIKKRKGLVIIKKKRPQTTKSMDRFSTPMVTSKPKPKKQKKAAIKKNVTVNTLNIMSNSDFNDICLDDDATMMMPDFSDAEIKIDETMNRLAQQRKKQGNNNAGGRRPAQHRRPRSMQRQGVKKRRRRLDVEDEVITSIEIAEEVRVYEFAEAVNKTVSDVMKVLFTLGMMVTRNDFLDKDHIEILADEFDIEVKTINIQDEFDYEKEIDDEIVDESKLNERTPIITIMGHVDHGKTSLLDRIRKTKVTAGEHGGITQHVGAYMVSKNGHNITFIDTPGHAAFTEMRSRGAKVTDIAVIIVAADDGVKPQTKEAIDHVKAADVPFIVAINKIDKSDANPDLVKSQLAEIGVTPTDWGGDVEFISISAQSGEGIDELLEVLNIQAEILELKADKTAKVKATVIESSLEVGKGPVATVIVQNGTLKVGDIVVCGVAHGKVKAIFDDTKNRLTQVNPGEPAVIVGLSGVVNAGDILVQADSDKKAREFAAKRHEYLRQKELSHSTKVTLEELGSRIAEGNIKNLPVIIKADVNGSLEAIKSTLTGIKNDEVKVNIIRADVGGITEGDLALAEASENCVILGFNVRPTGAVKRKANDSGITLRTYRVIYDLVDDVKGLLGGMLSPIKREENIGQAEVKEVFMVPKLGAISGCMVTDGSILRGAKVRVIREGIVIYEGEVSSLKRFKDDAKEVAKGYECGIGIQGYNDVKEGDYIESFKIIEEQASIDD